MNWNSSLTATAKEALRLAFEDGAAKPDLTFDKWYARIEERLNTGTFLSLQKHGAIYRLLQRAAHFDITENE